MTASAGSLIFQPMPQLRNRVFRTLAATAFVALAVPLTASAQTHYYATGGVQYTSTLLEDNIFEPIDVRAGIGPLLTLGASRPVGTQAQAGLEVGLALTPLEAREGGLTRDLGSVTTLSALANLSGRISGPIGWRVGIGIVSYLGGSDAGIFQDGNPTRLLVGGGFDYRRAAFTGWDLMISARYDHHRFTTETLDRRGFANAHGVHRASVSAGLARRLR